MSNNYIIVPIAAQVIVVPRDNNVAKSNLASRLNGNTILGENQQFDLQAVLNPIEQQYFDKGVHVHWKLPKALKHGIANDEGEIEFPLVPNRWMIVRYQTSNLNDLTNIPSKTWIVKSDEIDTNKASNWVLLEEVYVEDKAKNDGSTISRQKYDFKAVGQVDEWDNRFVENEDNSVKLTALSAINPYFSEIYDDCNAVFGFHDTMENQAFDNTFAYVITGWYSNERNDPYHPQTTANTEIVAKIKKSWVLAQEQIELEKSIFSTTIQSVKWEDNNSYALNAEITLALGNTTTEAYSALLLGLNKDRESQLPNTETYLNALQNSLLESDKETPSLLKLEIENHKKQFTPKQRNSIWQIRKIDKDNPVDKNNDLPHFPNEPELVKTLKKVNELQIQLNTKKEQLKSLQQEYYFCWYKNVLHTVAYDENTSNYEDFVKDDLEKYKDDIQTGNKDIKNLEDSIWTFINVIVAQYDAIQIPSKTKEKANYELVQEVEDRFWEPNDPAILFYSAELDKVQDFYLASNDTIKCRIVADIVEELTIDTTNKTSASLFNLPNLKIENSAIPSEVIRKLVFESLALNENLALFIAKEMEGNDRESTSEIIKEYAKKHVNPFQNKAKESIEKFALQKEAQHWIPQFVSWEVAFVPSTCSDEIVCKGFTPLTNGVAKNLNEQFSGDFKNPYQNILAQNLSGFNKQLVAQIAHIQFPPLEFESDEEGNFNTNFIIDKELISLITENAYGLACNPYQDVFSPIRNGKITFKKIALIDTFGRTQTIVADKVTPTSYVSKNLISILGSSAIEIELHNRIIQPSRLQFNWLNQQGEILHQDTGKLDHPILGWLVPNYLDNRLMVYDATGNEIKAIRITDSNKIEEYIPNNDGLLSVAAIKENREKNQNSVLNTILENLAIEEIITESKALNQKMAQTITNNSVISLLYGQPIAIAKGEIKLELLGDAIRNPMWEKSTTIDTGNIENHTIKIKMGDSALSNDGLLGYYVNNDYSKLFYSTEETTIDISPNNKPIHVTLLLVANTGFYIKSEDYLPAKFVQMHQHATEELINDMNISFMLCPFMADKENPKIPVPSTAKNNWQWIHKSNVEVWDIPSEVGEKNKDEVFDFKTQQFYEGWIKINEFKQEKP